MQLSDITHLLGADAEHLLQHVCQKIPKETITAPGPRVSNNIFKQSDRNKAVRASLRRLYRQGKLGGTGYLSIFPVDQGVEHTAGYSFSYNPSYFDPQTIIELAVQSQASGVASTLGVLGLMSSKYARKIPFIVKLNHSQVMSLPSKPDQIMFAQVTQAAAMGAAGVGATIYFGSPETNRQIQEVSQAFAEAHRLGLFTILWCYPRNEAFQQDDQNHETSADISGQAIHLGVTLEADIIKQKMPTHNNQTFAQLQFGKHDDHQYQTLLSDHPIDMVRYQVANSYMGRIGLLNSGGASSGDEDLAAAVKAAVINKRGGGSGLIMGRKVFHRPFDKGVALMQAVQNVYLEPGITVA